MKNKDVIILKKILDYCKQLNEACDMFENDYNVFVSNSVFQNACSQMYYVLADHIFAESGRSNKKI